MDILSSLTRMDDRAVVAGFVLSTAALLLYVALPTKHNMVTGSNKVDSGVIGAEHRLKSRVALEDFPPTKNQNLLLAAKGIRTDTTPVWMMRQAGRYLPEFRELRKTYDFFSMCQNPAVAAEITIQPLERFTTLDAVIVFSDILVVPQAMGMECHMIPSKGPVFPEPLVFPSDIDGLTFLPSNEKDIAKFMDDRLGYVFDAINLTRQRVNGKVPVIGFSGAPFTLLCYMVEGQGSKSFEIVKTWMLNHPKDTHRLLQALTDMIIKYCIGQVRAGAQLIQIFESNAGELTVEDFNEFCFGYLEQIARNVKKELSEGTLPMVPLTVFARGANQEGILERLEAETEYDVIGLDWKIDPKIARERVTKKSLQGNLDPCTLYANKDVLRSHVAKMLEGFDVANNPRYIANLGHGMIPSHDPEHAAVFIDAVHELSAKLIARKSK